MFLLLSCVTIRLSLCWRNYFISSVKSSNILIQVISYFIFCLVLDSWPRRNFDRPTAQGVTKWNSCWSSPYSSPTFTHNKSRDVNLKTNQPLGWDNWVHSVIGVTFSPNTTHLDTFLPTFLGVSPEHMSALVSDLHRHTSSCLLRFVTNYPSVITWEVFQAMQSLYDNLLTMIDNQRYVRPTTLFRVTHLKFYKFPG